MRHGRDDPHAKGRDLGSGRAERFVVACFIGIAVGNLTLVTGAMILVGFGAVAAMSAHGYRVGSLPAGVIGLLVSGVVGRWAYRRRAC